MKNVKIDDIVYLIPESWNDITINKWRTIRNLQNYYSEDFTDTQRFEFNLEIISALTDIPFEKLLNIPAEYYTKLMSMLEFYQTVELKDEVVYSLMIEGTLYKLTDFNNLTLGDKANIDIIRDSSELTDRIGRIMSILYKPDDEKPLSLEERDDKEALFNEKVSINQVYGTMLFFLILIKKYKQNMKISSLQDQNKTMMKKMSLMFRIKMKMKQVLHNIIMVWRSSSQRATYLILKRFSK